MKFVVATILSSLFAASALAVEPTTVDLKPKFVVGQEDRFVVDMNSSRQAKFVESAVNRPETYRQKLRVKRRVTEVGEAGATLELTYEAVEVAIVAGAKSVNYDSEGINDSEAELSVGASVLPVLNKPVTVQVDAFGRVQKVTGNQNAPGAPPSLSLLGDEMFTRTLTPLYGLGKDPVLVKVGETWTEERKSPAGQTGAITSKRQHTLTSADAKLAKVTITGTLSLEPSEMATAAKTKVQDQSITGNIEWSLTAGSIRSYTYDQHMQLSAETEGKQRMAVTDFSVKMNWIEVWPPVAADTHDKSGQK